MLAGRKLLLADDSITIQKVVDLTFADEGVSVVCVNNGREAVERLEEFAPDVVLADIFMPQISGYEVCEYIKQNEKLKHIPVMLLVGSFEPFDEAEARRVGADDTLTKPFESIRRLIDKVSRLVSSHPSEKEKETAELPKPEAVTPEPEKLTEEEIKVTTADTQPLPAELKEVAREAKLSALRKQDAEVTTDTKVDELKMDSKVTEAHEAGGDVLLDLGDFQPVGSIDDFVLDIDLEEIPEPSPLEPAFSTPTFLRDRYKSPAEASGIGPEIGTMDQLAEPREFPKSIGEKGEAEAAQEISFFDQPTERARMSESTAERVVGEQKTVEQFSPEVIEAIARRAVEQLSEKVVQEIAWEVVPQLAELMIKRQLEEKNS